MQQVIEESLNEYRSQLLQQVIEESLNEYRSQLQTLSAAATELDQNYQARRAEIVRSENMLVGAISALELVLEQSAQPAADTVDAPKGPTQLDLPLGDEDIPL